MKKQLLKTAPKDKYNLVYIIFALQGIGQLFPFNVFITAGSYFTPRLCGSPFQSTYEFWINILANLASTFGMAMSIKGQFWCGQRARFVVPLLFNFLLFALTTGMVMIPAGVMNPSTFFVITMATVAATCITTSFVSAAAFGLSGLFPGIYAQAIMSGQGIAGVVVSLAAIISLVSTPKGEVTDECAYTSVVQYSSLGYFGFSALVLLLCVVSYFVLELLPFAHHFVRAFRSEEELNGAAAPGDDDDALEEEDEVMAVGSVVVSSRSFNASKGEGSKSLNAERTRRALEPPPPLGPTARKVWDLLAATFLVFTLTLLVFPAITEAIASSEPESSSRLFNDNNVFVSFGFVLFNVWDTVGRSMAGIESLTRCFPNRTLLPISILRFVFLPLLLLCNVPGKAEWLPSPLAANWCAWVLISTLAWSNGFISSIAIMNASSVVTVREAETATTLLAFAITFGCTVGAGLAFIVQATMLPDV